MKKRQKPVVNRERFIYWLKKYHACREARIWVNRNRGTPRQLWEKLDHDPDWLLWVYYHAGVDGNGQCTVRHKFSAVDDESQAFFDDACEAKAGIFDGTDEVKVGSLSKKFLDKLDAECCRIVRKRIRWTAVERLLKKHYRDDFMR